MQRKQFGALLSGLRRQLERKTPAKIEPSRGEMPDVGAEEDLQPLNEMLQAIASNRNKSHGDLLQRVDKAIRKLEDAPDDFGLCEECGDPILAGRLRAMPYAELCTDCQAEHDAPRGTPTRRKLTDYR